MLEIIVLVASFFAGWLVAPFIQIMWGATNRQSPPVDPCVPWRHRGTQNSDTAKVFDFEHPRAMTYFKIGDAVKFFDDEGNEVGSARVTRKDSKVGRGRMVAYYGERAAAEVKARLGIGRMELDVSVPAETASVVLRTDLQS